MTKRQFSGRKNVLLMLIVLIISAAVVSGAVLWRQHSDDDKRRAAAIPQDIPYLIWDRQNEAYSMQMLEYYLSERTPQVAIRNNPEFEWRDLCAYHFWVRSFSVTTYENTNYKVYHFVYTNDAGNMESMTKELETEAEDIIRTVRSMQYGDPWDEMLAVHDELIRRTQFVRSDDGGEHIRDLYGALVEHKAVCQGYAYAFTYLLDKLGYHSSDIYSKEHLWNRADDLMGSERYIDVTWDDYNNADRNGVPYIHHDFFCITKEEMALFDDHTPESDAIEEDTGGAGDNYYRRKQYYISSGDTIAFRASALEQFHSGKNLLEFRFESKDDFDKAAEEIKVILATLGYKEKYYTYSKNELLTFSVGLYPPVDAE